MRSICRPMGVADDNASYTIGRPLMISGRQPAPSDPDGVWVDRTFAASEHLKVGQTFTWTLITPSLLQRLQVQHSEAGAKAVLASGVRSRARIDGIGVTSDGVVIDPVYDPSSIWLTPAFRVAHPGMQSPYWGAMVKLKPGTNLDNFTAHVRALDPNESIAFQRGSAITAEVSDATGPQVIALAAFAALAALLGLVVLSQAFSRRMQSDALANPTLAAMGMTRPQRMAASLAKTMLAVVGGTLLALVVAVATSGLGPVGVVRVAEVHPGVTFDWPLLLAGAAGIVVAGSTARGTTGLALVQISAQAEHSEPVRRRRRSRRGGRIAGGGARNPLRARVRIPARLGARANHPVGRGDGSRSRHVDVRVLGQPRPSGGHPGALRRALGRAHRSRQPQLPQRLRWEPLEKPS